jgi:hypothetical protein
MPLESTMKNEKINQQIMAKVWDRKLSPADQLERR